MATTEGNKSELDAEARHAEEVARAHAALAAAQDRTYWLDRWGVDLNSLMRKPGADELRRGLRAIRAVLRKLKGARGRASLLAGKVRASGGSPAGAAAAPQLSVFEREISPDRLATSIATDIVFERLTDDDVTAVEGALDAEQQRMLDGVEEADRRRLLIAFGVHHQIAGVLERTGLTPAMPPEDVHAMGRGAAAAGGSLYYADLVADGLAAGGVTPGKGQTFLDFGCSSGRAVRALAAAFPAAQWKGCDPIGAAISWAQENIEGIEFLNSPERPPLPYDDGSLDAAYAISIWSHFNAPAAKAWLAEMHRLIRPGGLLLLTTHGWQSIPHARGHRVRGEEQLAEIAAALDREAFWFKDEFGVGGDHGVVDVDWGTAFLTAEWLLEAVTPAWKVVAFAPGRVEDNQDLYVLERR